LTPAERELLRLAAQLMRQLAEAEVQIAPEREEAITSD
jgi:hypothetical protein